MIILYWYNKMKGENTVMNGAEKKKATPADKAVNAIIVLIILVFVAVGVYATYGKISEGVTNKEIELLAIQSKQRLLKAKCLTI